jgi:uncharacterized hydantoinase/oxoprolinase family protein
MKSKSATLGAKRHTKAKKAATGKPIDPSKPCNSPKEEAFAQDVFSGKSNSDAYRANYNTTNKANKTVHEAASRLRRKVCARVEHLQSQVANDRIMSKVELAETYSDIIRTRHSDFLVMGADGVWMHDIGAETIKQAALKKVKTRCSAEGDDKKQFDEIELESKVAAGKALADLMGYNAPSQQVHTGKDGGPIQQETTIRFVKTGE